jgi:hypothetical protein
LLGWLMVWLVTTGRGGTRLHWELVSLQRNGLHQDCKIYVFIYVYISYV